MTYWFVYCPPRPENELRSLRLNSATLTIRPQTHGMRGCPTTIYTTFMQSVTLLTYHLPGAIPLTFWT